MIYIVAIGFAVSTVGLMFAEAISLAADAVSERKRRKHK